MKPIETLHLQMRLEGIGLDSNRLLRRGGLDGEDLPLILLAQTTDGQRVKYLSADLPEEARQLLLAQAGHSSLYSHKVENLASARLANAMMLLPVFEEIVFEREEE